MPGLQALFNVSPELARIIGTKKGERITRSECMKRVWAYLKQRKLQDPSDKQWFTPDVTMAPVFGSEKIKGFGMTKYLKKHLTYPEVQEELDVSPELAKIIGSKKGERVSGSECMKRVWAYIKEKKLQDPLDKQLFTPDVTMAPVFGNEKIKGFGMFKYLKMHLAHPGGSSFSHSTPSAGSSSSRDLECPVCFKTVKPPMRLQQCGLGHIICDDCHRQMTSLNPRTGNQCTTCRGPITGRPNALEKMAGLL